jgi:7-cyano-7-deazaguanine reductase
MSMDLKAAGDYMITSEYEHLQDEIRNLVVEPGLEAFENKYPDREYHIQLKFDEFTCVCPRTGLPDFATILIDYIPAEFVVESKSLKLYLNGYRDIGIFSENVVNKILGDMVAVCQPRFAEVTGIFNPRGGVDITVTACHGDDGIGD